MSALSNVMQFAANNRSTTAVSILAGAVVGFLANHFYFYVPGAAVIGVAVAAISLWVASRGKPLFGRVAVVEPPKSVPLDVRFPDVPAPVLVKASEPSTTQKIGSFLQKKIPFLASAFKKEIDKMVKNNFITQEVANEVIAAAENIDIPYNFYKQIHIKFVEREKLTPTAAFWVLRNYDKAKGLTTTVTDKITGYLLAPRPISLVDGCNAYKFYQTYRIVHYDENNYKELLKILYPDQEDEARIRYLEAYQSARFYSNTTLMVESQRLRKDTRVSTPPAVSVNASRNFGATKPEVWNMTTFLAAQELVRQGYKPAVLNMANEDHAGGGFVTGAMAQEEHLCRQSNLYEGLEYAKIKGLYPLGEFAVILTPHVTFFRDDNHQLLNQTIEADIIGSAAYICGRKSANRPASEQAYKEGMKGKIRSMFRMAVQNGNDSLLLSAFGCGAFGNKPEVVSRLYQEVLSETEFTGCFRKVVFGIINDKNGTGNLDAFKQRFPFLNNLCSYRVV
jgi:uncharacterized protein (TIGR02452 family)